MTTSIERRALILAILVACGTWGFALPARAATALAPAAQDYIKLRAKTQAVVGIALRDMRGRVQELRGKVVEIGGTITGTMSRRGESIEGRPLISFLLNDGKGGSAIIQCLEGEAEVKPQNKVRVLVQLDKDAQALDFAPLKAIVREADLPEQWREQPKPATSQSQPSGSASTASGKPASKPGSGAAASAAATPRSVGPELVTTVQTPTTPKSGDEPRASPTPTLALDRPNSEQMVDIYANLIPLWNKELTEAERDLIARCILYYSPQYNLDHRLVFAMVACESSFHPLATSPKGAMGLGQLMPGTAAGLGVSDAYDIQQNLRGAIQYLAGQIHRYTGRSNYDMFCLGVASYNAGPNRVASAGKVPNIPETIRYVNKVAALFKELHDKGYP